MAKDMRITDGSELRITENSHMILDDGSQVLIKGREAEPLFIGQVQNIAPVAAHIKEVNHIDPISIEALFVKVCGDGLTPKALYWLDRLGCVRQVLQETHSFIDRGDIFINGSHVLTGKFPQSTPYPGFGVLLDKKRLDHLLVQNAVAHGAAFRPGCKVKKLHWTTDAIWVEAEADGTTQFFRAKLVVGADGANSTVSRAIGNKILDGATAVSLRGYYQRVPGSPGPGGF